MGGLTMQRFMLLAWVALAAISAACGGHDGTATLGSATLQEGMWCPEDPATFVGPLPQECLPA